MWVTIIFLSIVGIIYFLKQVFKLKKGINLKGGMRGKYATLIELLSEGDSRVKIHREESTYITFGVQGVGSFVKFEIEQGFAVAIIVWIADSNIFGTQKLKWEFNDQLDQRKMFELMSIDIGKSNDLLSKKFPNM